MLPVLDFVGPGVEPGRAVGGFVFDVKPNGVVTLSDLGLKVGVGNKEGGYKLRVKLHYKSSEGMCDIGDLQVMPVRRPEPDLVTEPWIITDD